MTKKNKPGRNRKDKLRSTLGHHKRSGSKLVPPLMHALGDKAAMISWVNGRLVEMLWAVLLIHSLPRKEALSVFIKIVEEIGFSLRETFEQDSLEEHEVPDLTLTGISRFPADLMGRLMGLATATSEARLALQSMLLIGMPPAIEDWKLRILVEEDDVRNDEERLSLLASAVMECLDHQSQSSTDIRWMRLMFRVSIGKFHLPREVLKSWLDYPKHDPGDEVMRSLRPSIRAAEIGIGSMSVDTISTSLWVKEFWGECLERTACIEGDREGSERVDDSVRESAFESLRQSAESLYAHFHNSKSTSNGDHRHEVLFGLAFYGVNLFLETILGGNSSGISGRLLLRALCEVRITLAYLLHKNEPELWSSFKEFGIGQAKLALLKFDAKEAPQNAESILDEAELSIIANEEKFEEFVSVELGHWASMDLRKMAEASGTKPDYDEYFGWTSTFVHGSWAAVRSSAMTICGNPLHRLHRIPVGAPRSLPNSVAGANSLLNSIFECVDTAYPGFSTRVALRVEKRAPTA